MAEEFLEEIYKEAYVITKLKKIVEYTIYQENHHVLLEYNKITTDLEKICKNYAKIDINKGMMLYHYLEQITKLGFNVTVLGDIINKKVIPLIEEYIKLTNNIQVMNEEEDYEFLSTDSGFLTLRKIENNFYLHSTDDPMWEARKMVEHIYNPRKKEYAVWGCGLGYIIYQLYKVSYGSIKISVFEPDERLVEYARNYGVLDWVPEDNIEIYTDKDILPFLYCAEREDTAMFIFKPEFDSVPKDVQQIIANLYVEEVTDTLFKDNLAINFWRNVESDSKLISQLDISNLKKEFVVIAAGPSLDETIDFIKESKRKRTIIAVGTVFKKLIEMDIIPDMVVVLDPQERTYKQIEGVEDQQVPMIIGITAYWKFAAAYQGDKYLVPLAHTQEVMDYAIKNKIDLWGCGGTVTSLGIEAAIRFGAEKIYLVGVDLAYPGGVSHASNTMDREIKGTTGMHLIKGVDGNKVYTSNAFLTYIEWIENRIKETPHIKYYNMSKIGAHIEGAENIK